MRTQSHREKLKPLYLGAFQRVFGKLAEREGFEPSKGF
jgi:hypothetical protein